MGLFHSNPNIAVTPVVLNTVALFAPEKEVTPLWYAAQPVEMAAFLVQEAVKKELNRLFL